MTIMFAHDNDVSDLFVGKKINKDELFYQEGIKGNATGNHCHIECAKGKYISPGWYKNNNGSISGTGEAITVRNDANHVNVINNYNYDFKKITITPQEPIKEEFYKVAPEDKKMINKFIRAIKAYRLVKVPLNKPIDHLNIFQFL